METSHTVVSHSLPSNLKIEKEEVIAVAVQLSDYPDSGQFFNRATVQVRPQKWPAVQFP